MSITDELNRAVAEVGYTESPAGSNRNKFSAFWRRPPEPWCADFACWTFMPDVDLTKFCDNTSYTPNLHGDLAALGWSVNANAAQPGDLVFFNWDGKRIDHVGRVRSASPGVLHTIEGNTGGASQSNGGCVMTKDRAINRTVAALIRVPVPGSAPAVAATNALAQLQQVIFFAKQIRLGGPGDPNPTDAVKIAQTGLNRWADRFAAMTHAANPPDIAVTGLWDDATRRAVVALQQLTGHNEMGMVGPQTWALLYP